MDEKRYHCEFCSRVFGNKNDAKRHQRSLHARPYFWSCAAIVDIQKLLNISFALPLASSHTLSHQNCVFCGRDSATQPRWEDQVRHLTQHHQMHACKQEKKFYRADHFAQHLRYRHRMQCREAVKVLAGCCIRGSLNSKSSRLSTSGKHCSIRPNV